MKKMNIIVLVVILLIILISMIVFLENDKVKYSSGKDTVESFGNGTFQILKGPDKKISLVDVEKNNNIEEEIKDYKKIKNKIYIFGKIGYTVVDFNLNEIKQYKASSDFPGWKNFMIKEYGEKYIVINKYNDFTNTEKKVFNEMKKK